MAKPKKPTKATDTSVPRVLLMIETSTGYGRGLLEGIGRWISEHRRWSIHFEERGLQAPLPRWIKGWQGDGVISRTTTLAMGRQLQGLNLPMVELLGTTRAQPAKVHADNAAAGRMAAEHLIDCGLREFGFFGFVSSWWIVMFREGFCSVFEDRGHACHIYPWPSQSKSPADYWDNSHNARVIRWLESLPRPIGIFAANSFHARCLLNACRDAGIAVPDEIAVMGANNDEGLCSVSDPPLTAIDQDLTRIGYEAATMLDGMMSTGSRSEEVLWIPPRDVVVRQSTNILAVDDADLVQAIRFIREHACRGIDVSDVVDQVPLSRRVLERRFKQSLNRTPKQEILRVKIKKAKFLIAQSDRSIESVAQQSGFSSFRHFAEIFRREVGMTPRAYRRLRQNRSATFP